MAGPATEQGRGPLEWRGYLVAVHKGDVVVQTLLSRTVVTVPVDEATVVTRRGEGIKLGALCCGEWVRVIPSPADPFTDAATRIDVVPEADAGKR